jgi:hypothetical protein
MEAGTGAGGNAGRDPALRPWIARIEAVLPAPIDAITIHDGGDDFLAIEVNHTRALGLAEGWSGWRRRAGRFFESKVASRLSPNARRGALAQLAEFFEIPVPPVVVHGDLCFSEHVFWDPDRQALSGIIDFGDLTLFDATYTLEYGFAERFEQRLGEIEAAFGRASGD